MATRPGQQLLSMIVDRSYDAVVGMDRQRIITLWNHPAELLYGYSAQEAIGRPVTMLVPPEHAPELTDLIDVVFRNNHIEHLETTQLTRDGAPIEVGLTIYPVRLPNGGPGASMIIRDLSARRPASQELEQVGHSWPGMIVNSSEYGIGSVDLDGLVRSWNRGAEKLYGYTAGEIVGTPAVRLLPPGRTDEWQLILQQIRAGAGFLDFETERISKTGERKHLSMAVSPIRNVDNEIIGASVFARDISEAHARQQLQAQLAAIVESSDDAIFTTSSDGTVLTWNSGAVRMFGYSSEETLGKSCSMLMPGESRDELCDFAARANRLETECVRKDGSRFSAVISATPIADTAAGSTLMAVVAHDVSDQMRAEAARRANELKDELVAVVSHEFRTPLTSISGFASTILDRLDTLTPDETRSFIEIIEAQSKRLERLVGDMLILAGIEARPVELQLEPIALAPAIEQATEELSLGSVEIECEPDICVLYTRDHLIRILSNLLDNMVKYGVRPYVVTALRSDRNWITVEVCDSGSGVPPEFEARLFERFSRAPDQIAGSSGGTGLGLSIVRALATAHGGEARYRRNTPHGACFQVLMPACEGQSATAPPSAPEAQH